MKKSTVAIVGTGVVGSTTAYTLLLSGFVSKIMLIDTNVQRCKGELEDLLDARPFGGNAEIVQGTLQEAGQADIVIIAAGMAQKPDQPRIELLNTNRKIIASIIAGMKPLNKDLIIIMVTNPVDVLTLQAQELSGLPRNQIFGSGTLLDSQRLRGKIGDKLGIAQQSIHAYVLGEHGDTQFVAWSCANIGGVPLAAFSELSAKELEQMAQEARQKVYEIIRCKGSTAYGIAACVTAYCQNILLDSKRIAPVSCFVEELKVCLSMPAVLGKQGVERILRLPLSKDEQAKLAVTAAAVRELL
jgi:L-lactate dehydrogenase